MPYVLYVMFCNTNLLINVCATLHTY